MQYLHKYYIWVCPSLPSPGWPPPSCIWGSPPMPVTFSSSLLFRHAAFGLRLRSVWVGHMYKSANDSHGITIHTSIHTPQQCTSCGDRDRRKVGTQLMQAVAGQGQSNRSYIRKDWDEKWHGSETERQREGQGLGSSRANKLPMAAMTLAHLCIEGGFPPNPHSPHEAQERGMSVEVEPYLAPASRGLGWPAQPAAGWSVWSAPCRSSGAAGTCARAPGRPRWCRARELAHERCWPGGAPGRAAPSPPPSSTPLTRCCREQPGSC